MGKIGLMKHILVTWEQTLKKIKFQYKIQWCLLSHYFEKQYIYYCFVNYITLFLNESLQYLIIYLFKNKSLTVNDRISPQGLICQN